MEKPEMCPNEVYDIMKECWALDPQKRPTLDSIAKRITAISRNYIKEKQMEQMMSTNLKKEEELEQVYN